MSLRAKAAVPSAVPSRVQRFISQVPPDVDCGLLDELEQPIRLSDSDGASPEVADVPSASPEESQQYGANDSTMGFAKILLGEDDESDSPASGTIPGDAGRSKADPQTFPWISTPLPSLSLLQVAVDAYFDRVNWYIMLFHRPSFEIRTKAILRQSAWRRDELCEVLLVAMVAALGLRCVEHDRTWEGHHLLGAHSLTAESLISNLMSQIGSHFYEVMLESRIEAYQICMLLTTYHVYFGSSNFAWNVSGVSTRTAYALALHCEKVRSIGEIPREVSNRCWNHLIVSDQFSSMIFGRPAALDPAFANIKQLADLDDTELPQSTAKLPFLQEHNRPVSFLTYHSLKFELYHIIRQTLQSFRVLHLQSPVSVQDLKALIRVVSTTELMLKQWHECLPAIFKPSEWPSGDPWNLLELDQCSAEEQCVRQKIGLQGLILQLIYDAAIVWAHRPLLKLRISIPSKAGSAKDLLEDIPDSLGTSVRAALRMSRVPVSNFDGQLAQSFVLMHLFTAGVILCIAPTSQPYSPMAGEAKTGVLRIIAACRAIKDENKIARHTDQMLTRLYKKTMQREMDIALRTPETGISDDRIGQAIAQRKSRDNSDEPRLHRESNIMSHSTSQVDVVTPTAPTEHDWTVSDLDYHACDADELPEEEVISYLQFGSHGHNDNMDSHINEHINEAYGAFEQRKCEMSLVP